MARLKGYHLAPVPKAGVEGTHLLPQAILIMARPNVPGTPSNEVKYRGRASAIENIPSQYRAGIPVGSTIVIVFTTNDGGPGQFDKQGFFRVSSIFCVRIKAFANVLSPKVQNGASLGLEG